MIGMCKPYIDSPSDYGIAEDIAFNLYAMDCEGYFGSEAVNININIDPTSLPSDDLDNLIKEIERVWQK